LRDSALTEDSFPNHACSRQVLVLRHGLTEWNAAGRWQGWADIPLTDVGRSQARVAAERLQDSGVHFYRVVFSDLERAAETATLIADLLGINERVPDAGWRERDIGHWSGLLTYEIEARWPGQLDAWRDGMLERVPGGELEDELQARILESLHVVLADPRPALVVTHGGVIRTLDRVFGVEPRPVPNVGGRWFGTSTTGAVLPGSDVDLLSGPRPNSVVL
jgi:glucosyl-3-phosphoglycerate phosphatase